MTISGVAQIETPVLVLNQNYQPLNICSARRALVLMGHGKAESIVNGHGEVRSAHDIFPLPSVVRLFYMVKKPIVERRLSRRALFYRDNFTCQYCGQSTRKLTIDHVIPRCKGGKHNWENVVSACVSCNHKKAGLTPSQAKMSLRRKAEAPNPNPYYIFYHRHLEEEWRPFIPWEH